MFLIIFNLPISSSFAKAICAVFGLVSGYINLYL